LLEHFIFDLSISPIHSNNKAVWASGSIFIFKSLALVEAWLCAIQKHGQLGPVVRSTVPVAQAARHPPYLQKIFDIDIDLKKKLTVNLVRMVPTGDNLNKLVANLARLL
jgi:hypothetical protein